MPPSAMSSPLRIELRPSLALRLCLLALGVLAGLALWLSAAPGYLMPVPALLLALAWPRRRRDAPVAVVLRGDGTLAWLDAGGDEHEATPRALQRRGPLTVMTLAQGTRSTAHVFTPETLAAAERRRLAQWFERHVSSSDSPSPVAHV
jgi:hypothetical protein